MCGRGGTPYTQNVGNAGNINIKGVHKQTSWTKYILAHFSAIYDGIFKILVPPRMYMVVLSGVNTRILRI